MKLEWKRGKGTNCLAVLWGGGHAVAAFLAILHFAPKSAIAQDTAIAKETRPSLEVVEQHLRAGEFSSARKISEQLAGVDADLARAAIAQRLSSSGQTTAALGELDSIKNPELARSAAAQLLGRRTHGKSYDPASANYRTSSTGGSAGNLGPVGNGPPMGSGLGRSGLGLDGTVNGGSGGGVIADFNPLMSLIQTTIAPDQWDLVGGPSTMFPYPAGIYVDPNGLVQDIEVGESDRLQSLASLARSGNSTEQRLGRQNDDWTKPSDLRIVSLKRLRQHFLRLASTGNQLPVSMQNLAGLNELQYVIIEDDDILLAGPVGGIDPAAVPWPQDRVSKKSAFGLDLLVSSASSVVHNRPYGCTIDPTPEGLQAAAQVSAKISRREIAPPLASDALAAAVGRQNILLFDVPADQPLAWLLVDADRHMKQLALGQHPMPRGIPNYLDVVEAATRQADGNGVPNGQLLRMWFAVQPKTIRKATDSQTFELDGLPLRLITAKEFSDNQGGRIRAGADPLGQQFADGFNRHFDSIAAMYPIYDRLRGAFELTAALQLVKTQVDADKFARVIGELADPDIMFAGAVSVPKQCDSLAVRHTIRTPSRRHEIYIVSGGIKIDPAQSLVSKITPYPVLDDLNVESSQAPVHNTRWWWDR